MFFRIEFTLILKQQLQFYHRHLFIVSTYVLFFTDTLLRRGQNKCKLKGVRLSELY